MQARFYSVFVIFFLILGQMALPVCAQLGISFDIKKPQEYDERQLRSEKSDQKKFTLPRRFFQNTFTHYNYFFNANNKLNEVLTRAKEAHKDDYSKLLSFYNYSLAVTAKEDLQLDSVQFKSQTGIALHDLRNDWVDNLYLLWGIAHYLKQEFDSAFLMFQFINYAFAEKEKDGYYKTIGSSMDGNTAFSISTKEKRSLPRRLLSRPPSRNDAFIWQIRNYLAQDQFAEAASLIVTLRHDPHFPKRLYNDLHEVQAWWFYKQNMWDSAAHHLVRALGNATSKQEKARWEYLAAQMYELAGNYKESEKFYAKAIKNTTDPVMDIYARLNSIRVNKDGGENYIEKNISQLLKMARRDKYRDYRDIIYFMAAQMELERNNPDATYALLLKSSKYISGNPAQRNKTFLQLADLAFARKEYKLAFGFYDSLDLRDPSLAHAGDIADKKEMLGKLALAMETIERQDSLQRVAAMPEDERKEFVRKLVRQLRRQQGLKDEGSGPTGSPFAQMEVPLVLGGGEGKGEWYFYNPSLRTRGAGEFKARWGNRPNTDNWRRSAVVGNLTLGGIQPAGQPTGGKDQPAGADEITFDVLYDKLPLTEEQLKISNDSIRDALFASGKIFIYELEDCAAGVETFEKIRSRFAQTDKMDEVLFALYYCYRKNGETAKAEEIKKLMAEKYASSNYTAIVTTGKNPQSAQVNPEATRAYEHIYDLFIEGNFEQALLQKKMADEKFGNHYWTPQLLYIEAVYYIKERQDSAAIQVLNALISQFGNSPLAPRAQALIQVLRRRNEIEQELSNLVITRPREEPKPVPIATVQPTPPPAITNPSPAPIVVKPKPDTIAQQPPTPVVSPFTHTPAAAHYVVLILNKVDPVFVREARNAFFRYSRETYRNKIFTIDLLELDAENKLLLISPFKDLQEAVEYSDRAKPVTATDIIPWLRGGKYYYAVITEKNLDLLKANKDLEHYRNFLNQQLPGKF